MRSLFLISSTDSRFLSSHHLDDIKLKTITPVPEIENTKEAILKTLKHLKPKDLKIKHHFSSCFQVYEEHTTFDSVQISLN